MRILTLSNTYPPHYYGGYELTCADTMRRFAAAGHQVLVLTSTIRRPGVAAAPAAVEPVEVRRELTVAWDWEHGRPAGPRSPLRRWRHVRSDLDALRRAVAHHRPDVVSVWHAGALSMALLSLLEELLVPTVLVVANDWLLHAAALDPWLRLCRRLPGPTPRHLGGVPTRPPALTATSVAFVSAATRARTVAAGRRDLAGADVVHPGIDLDDFPLQPGPPSPDWRGRLLYVGRLDPDKGVATAVQALPLLDPEVSLTVVQSGDEGYAEQLRALAAQVGVADRLRFVGPVPRSHLAAHYRCADAVVFPSQWDEPFGLVPLEAMACAVPVVATGTGGSGEYLEDMTNALLFPAGDAGRLAAAVRRLAADPALRARLVTGGTATARRHTADGYAEALLARHEAAARTAPRR